MTVTEPPDFVQIGATRDGLDPYLEHARRRGLRAVLVETPAYLRWRRALRRRDFDVELAVDDPQSLRRTRAALAEHGIAPRLVLAGFERYVTCAFGLASLLKVAPWPSAGPDFRPLDKSGQRAALAEATPPPRQPWFRRLDDVDPARAEYPCVLKPTDGGGGLGVYLAEDAVTLRRGRERIRGLRNYGGGVFSGAIAEEFVPGPEVSLQGVAYDGEPALLSVCEKLTGLEPDGTGLLGFREIGHVARPGDAADPRLRELARRALRASRYRQGPFHLDAIDSGAGPVFIEMGFRLSGGGLVSLVEQATGADWAGLSLEAALGAAPPPEPTGRGRAVGQVTVVTESELDLAARLDHADATVRIDRIAPADPSVTFTAAELESLASDRLRHTGSLARVRISAPEPATVRRLLETIVAERLSRLEQPTR